MCVDDFLTNFWSDSATGLEGCGAGVLISVPFIEIIFGGTGRIIDGMRLLCIDVLRPKRVSLLNVSLDVCIVFAQSPDAGG